MAKGIEDWREYLRTANEDIFHIIENAIIVAASDCPSQFRLKRDRIKELLFASNDAAHRFNDLQTAGEDKTHEVSMIKGIIDNKKETDAVLLDSLRKLESIPMSVDIFQTTMIGKSVNALRRHGSKEIKNLARKLVGEWKCILRQWCEFMQPTTGAKMEAEPVKSEFLHSTAPEEQKKQGPSKPNMTPNGETGQVITRRPKIIIKIKGKVIGKTQQEPEGDAIHKKPMSPLPKVSMANKLEDGTGTMQKELKSPVPKVSIANKSKSVMSTIQKEPRSPAPKASISNKSEGGTSTIQKEPRFPLSTVSTADKSEGSTCTVEKKLMSSLSKVSIANKPEGSTGTIEKKPMSHLPKKSSTNGLDIGTKLEASKRKLHERYEDIENAKKRRKIQVIDWHNLPKQTLARNSEWRPFNHRQHRPYGRR